MQSLGLIKASLQGFSVLITGGGSGIGLSTAELFAEMNANVAINYLPSDKESIKRINLLSKNLQIRTNSIVKSVNYSSPNNITVSTISKNYECDYVICSVPLGVLKSKSIEFNPELPKYLQPDVRVNAVSPGFTITNMTKQRSKSHKEKMAKQTLLKRNAKPKEIAEIIFMLCVSGNFVTGKIINVDGGHGYIY